MTTQTDDEAVLKDAVYAANLSGFWMRIPSDNIRAIAAHVDHLQSALTESIRLQGEYASEVERLKGALERPSNARFLKAPEPVARPDDEWCRRYAEWHEERYGAMKEPTP